MVTTMLLDPGEMFPVSHVNEPALCVDVCTTESWFFQTTLVPAATVSGLGEYPLGPSRELFSLIDMTTSTVLPVETGLDLVLHERVARPSVRTVMTAGAPRIGRIVRTSR